jgi:hypothetical protein
MVQREAMSRQIEPGRLDRLRRIQTATASHFRHEGFHGPGEGMLGERPDAGAPEAWF